MSTQEIKKALKEKRAVIGKRRTIKLLLVEKLKKVFLAKNCDEKTRKKIEGLCKIAGVPVETYHGTNMDLGTICRKPHTIMVFSIK